MKSNENLKGAFELGRACGIGSRLCLVDLGDQTLGSELDCLAD